MFALESMLTNEERDSLTEIYWASRITPIGVPLWQATERYRHVEHTELGGNRIYFNVEGVRQDFQLGEDVLDFSVTTKFPEFFDRPFHVSTWLKEPPARLPHGCGVNMPYVTIQHETPINSPEQRAQRDLDGYEWQYLIKKLEREQLVGVVVNSADASPPPEHPRLVNLVGKTSYLESIAVLRHGVGYWGIASSLCVLASQLFPAHRLLVKGPESWLHQHRFIYFAPHEEFPFLHEHFGKAPLQTITKGMTTVRFKTWRLVANNLVGPGSVVEVKPEDAAVFVKTGQAELYTPTPKPLDLEKLRTADAPPKTRKARRFD